jgi:hypothetical protein
MKIQPTMMTSVMRANHMNKMKIRRKPFSFKMSNYISEPAKGIEIIMSVNTRAILWDNNMYNFYKSDAEFLNKLDNSNLRPVKVFISPNEDTEECKQILSCIEDLGIEMKRWSGERKVDQRPKKKKFRFFCF